MAMGAEMDAGRLEQLSALADGELDPADTAAACACWQGDVQVRSAWHAYHLIGDVLRSDDLAADPARDEAFLSTLRTRLAAEPVVLAPEPYRLASANGDASADPGRRWPWLVSSAVAAGFVAMVGTYVWIKPSAPSAPVTALAGAGPQPVVVAKASDASAAPASAVERDGFRAVAMGGVMRDPRLDAYLAAHKQFAGTSALGVPSAFLRSAPVESPRR